MKADLDSLEDALSSKLNDGPRGEVLAFHGESGGRSGGAAGERHLAQRERRAGWGRYWTDVSRSLT